jgi:GDP-4-dehydro-6-deoxy-D-mannose reductase
MSNGYRALVTGSEGFVGRVLCRHLSDAGWDVAGCDARVAEGAQNRRRCDLAVPAAVAAMVEWAGPVTHVFHLAGVTFVPQAVDDPVFAMAVNYGGLVNLVAALETARPQARVVAVSSSDVYGPPRVLPIAEDHPLNPTNPYSISKAAADWHCAFLKGRSPLQIVRARPFNHAGPGQNDQFVLPGFARQVARIEAGLTEPILRVGNLTAARDFSHVRDVARAYELLALKGQDGEAYNICSGVSRTIRDAMERLLAMARVPIRVEVDPARWRPDSVQEVRGTHEKLTRQVGWEPQIGFDELLRELLDDWRAHEASGRAFQ